MTHYKLELSDQLDREFCQVALDARLTKPEVMSKALQLYLAAQRAVPNGSKVGVLDQDGELVTEFFGL